MRGQAPLTPRSGSGFPPRCRSIMAMLYGASPDEAVSAPWVPIAIRYSHLFGFLDGMNSPEQKIQILSSAETGRTCPCSCSQSRENSFITSLQTNPQSRRGGFPVTTSPQTVHEGKYADAIYGVITPVCKKGES